MSSAGAAPRAAVAAPGAPSRAAAPKSNARAAASRKNGAKSRGPKTPEGKARSAQNALKHGMRAQKHVVLPEEDKAEFAALEAALVQELTPVGALQTVLARRVAVAAWRLARADRIEAELFAERSWGADPNLGLALIRDGNGTRSFETLMRYRGAAMAEFMRALRTLKALQAEQAAMLVDAPRKPRPEAARHLTPNKPERLVAYDLPEPSAPGRTLHETAAPWTPNEPEACGDPNASKPAPPKEPDPAAAVPPDGSPRRGEPDEPQADAQARSRRTFSRHAWSAPVPAAPASPRDPLR